MGEGRTEAERSDGGSTSSSWPSPFRSILSIVGGVANVPGIMVLGESSDEPMRVEAVGSRCCVRFSDDVVTSARADRRGSVACRTAERGISVDEEGEWEDGGVPAPV